MTEARERAREKQTLESERWINFDQQEGRKSKLHTSSNWETGK